MMILLEQTCKESNQSIISKNTPLKVDELGYWQLKDGIYAWFSMNDNNNNDFFSP
jgi:hypothetical protein